MEFEIGTFLKKEDGSVLHRMTTTEERKSISHNRNTNPSLLRAILNGNRRITENNVVLLEDLKKVAKARYKIDSAKFA